MTRDWCAMFSTNHIKMYLNSKTVASYIQEEEQSIRSILNVDKTKMIVNFLRTGTALLLIDGVASTWGVQITENLSWSQNISRKVCFSPYRDESILTIWNLCGHYKASNRAEHDKNSKNKTKEKIITVWLLSMQDIEHKCRVCVWSGGQTIIIKGTTHLHHRLFPCCTVVKGSAASCYGFVITP